VKKINIIGAGLTGPLLSIYLARRGFDVSLYEKREDCRISSKYNGRSINLALSERGITSLKEISLYESIKEMLIPMRGRMIHQVDKELDFQVYGNDKYDCIYSVSRIDLNKKLLDLAESCGVNIRFNMQLSEYNLKSNKLDFRGEIIRDAFPIIGCDGFSSTVTNAICMNGGHEKKIDNLEYSYKELNILPLNNNFQLDENALHIWPRNSFMMIALPNTDKSFTCTLFLPDRGKNSFNEIMNQDRIESFFKNNFPDIIPKIPNYVEQYLKNPVSSLSTIYVKKWYHADKACVLGDAAHAIVPFFGQGMNAGFEDCSVFNKLLSNFKGDWSSIFMEFQYLRKDNCDAIAKMALENFIEMRDHVLDEMYIMKKKLSAIIERRHKNRFVSRYSMVSFHTIPYKEVYDRGVVQDNILDELISNGCNSNNLDFDSIDKLVQDKLNPIYE
tara:strand:+ start:235 stop:1566 length:1332 start_codon:yes stop_codon:yes gene_type:complete